MKLAELTFDDAIWVWSPSLPPTRFAVSRLVVESRVRLWGRLEVAASVALLPGIYQILVRGPGEAGLFRILDTDIAPDVDPVPREAREQVMTVFWSDDEDEARFQSAALAGRAR